MKKITIELSELDLQCLEHEIVDVPAWIQQTAAARARQIGTQLSKRAMDAAFNDDSIKTISADRDAILGRIFSHKDYMNAADKEAAREKARRAKEAARNNEGKAVEGLMEFAVAAAEPVLPMPPK